MTTSTQQALDLIGRVLLEPGDRVAVEEPGYPPARLPFLAQGAEVTGIPVDAEGLLVDALPPDTRAVYVTPPTSSRSACRCPCGAERHCCDGRGSTAPQ